MFLRAPGLQAGHELGAEIHGGSEAQAATITQSVQRPLHLRRGRPACSQSIQRSTTTVPPFVPADAGTQSGELQTGNGWSWIPAFAGMNGVSTQLRTKHPFIPRKGIRLDMMLG